MPENEKQGEPRPEATEEQYRSMSTDIAALAMPVAVVAAPVVNQWAKQHFGQGEKDTPAPEPQQQPKTD